MRIFVERREQELEGTPEEVFPFFADARNLDAITPPRLRFITVTPDPIEMRFGRIVQYRLSLHGVPFGWTTSIQDWDPPHGFVDVQVTGPFGLWHHRHVFEALPGGRTRMTDLVHYGVPFGPAGWVARKLFVDRDVKQIFDHRARVVPELLAASREGRAPR